MPRCSNILKIAGADVIAVVKTNFDLNSYLNSVINKTAENKKSVQDMNSEIVNLGTAPNYENSKMKFTVRIGAIEARLSEEYRNKWDVWTQTKPGKKHVTDSRTETVETNEEYLDGLYEASHEYMLFQKALAKITKSEELKWMGEYLTAVEEYEAAAKAVGRKKLDVESAKDKLGNTVALQSYINGVQSFLSTLAQKIRDSVKNYPAIQAKLRGSATFAATGTEFLDPYSNLHFCGMYAILHEEYAKATLNMFIEYLLQMMSHEETKLVCENDPERTVSNMLAMRKTWQSLGLYSWLTADHVSVVSYLRGLHPLSELRKEVFKEIIRYCAHRDGQSVLDFSVCNTASAEFPMTDHIANYVKKTFKPTMGLPKALVGGSAPEQQSAANGNSGRRGGQQQRGGPQHGAESAASANSEKAASADIPSAGGGDSKKVVMVDRTEKYKREITRADNLYCNVVDMRTGTRYNALYTATFEKCSMCSSGIKQQRHPKPNCFICECRTCHLYGHKDSECNNVPRDTMPGQARANVATTMVQGGRA